MLKAIALLAAVAVGAGGLLFYQRLGAEPVPGWLAKIGRGECEIVLRQAKMGDNSAAGVLYGDKAPMVIGYCDKMLRH